MHTKNVYHAFRSFFICLAFTVGTKDNSYAATNADTNILWLGSSVVLSCGASALLQVGINAVARRIVQTEFGSRRLIPHVPCDMSHAVQERTVCLIKPSEKDGRLLADELRFDYRALFNIEEDELKGSHASGEPFALVCNGGRLNCFTTLLGRGSLVWKEPGLWPKEDKNNSPRLSEAEIKIDGDKVGASHQEQVIKAMCNRIMVLGQAEEEDVNHYAELDKVASWFANSDNESELALCKAWLHSTSRKDRQEICNMLSTMHEYHCATVAKKASDALKPAAVKTFLQVQPAQSSHLRESPWVRTLVNRANKNVSQQREKSNRIEVRYDVTKPLMVSLPLGGAFSGEDLAVAGVSQILSGAVVPWTYNTLVASALWPAVCMKGVKTVQSGAAQAFDQLVYPDYTTSREFCSPGLKAARDISSWALPGLASMVLFSSLCSKEKGFSLTAISMTALGIAGTQVLARIGARLVTPALTPVQHIVTALTKQGSSKADPSLAFS